MHELDILKYLTNMSLFYTRFKLQEYNHSKLQSSWRIEENTENTEDTENTENTENTEDTEDT